MNDMLLIKTAECATVCDNAIIATCNEYCVDGNCIQRKGIKSITVV